MKVRRNRSQGVLLVCLALLLVGFGVIITSVDTRRGWGIYGAFAAAAPCVGLALYSFVRPRLVLGDRALIVYPLLGPKQHYPFTTRGEIRVVKRRLAVGATPVPVEQSDCDARDWDALVRSFSAR